MAVNGLLTSTLGQVANLSSRFQLAECTGLGFKPRMTLQPQRRDQTRQIPAADDQPDAATGRRQHRQRLGRDARQRVPRSTSTSAPSARGPTSPRTDCPAGAIYGEATVDTPILDYDLAGHVYLRCSDNLLPDVVPDLRGPAYQPIRLETAGRTDSIRGGIRTTIDFVPDAPFTKATVALQGGNKGLLGQLPQHLPAGLPGDGQIHRPQRPQPTPLTRALRAKCGKKAKRGRRRAKRRG